MLGPMILLKSWMFLKKGCMSNGISPFRTGAFPLQIFPRIIYDPGELFISSSCCGQVNRPSVFGIIRPFMADPTYNDFCGFGREIHFRRFTR